MRSLYSFLVEPLDERYNNKTKVGDIELILNIEIQDHKFVSRIGRVLETPINEKTNIKKGDLVIVHHNVFRRFNDIRGEEVNSKSYFEEDKYFVYPDQVFMYNRNGQWFPLKGFCFVKPINFNKKQLVTVQKERPRVGILKYGNSSLEAAKIVPGDLVGYTPFGEFEFIIDDERLYCMNSNDIVIKYEYQGDEKEYNPSWAKSS